MREATRIYGEKRLSLDRSVLELQFDTMLTARCSREA
jgi:hypothetical protein